MVDIVDKIKRSAMMSQIKSKNTKPELIVRQHLHKNGFRFRIHRNDLPGKPDIVLPKYNIAIQVRGCFWHMHKCQKGRLPKSNTSFWQDKLSKNVERDTKNDRLLEELGWKVIVIWECEIKSNEQMTIDQLIQIIKS